MGVDASYYGGVKHIRQFDVIYEYTITGDQSGVFKPFYRPTQVAQLVPLLPDRLLQNLQLAGIPQIG